MNVIRDTRTFGHGPAGGRSPLIYYGVGVVVLYAAMAGLFPSSAPLLEPDSAGYLSFATRRSSGYPAFLDLLQAIGLQAESVPLVQYGLYSLSLGVLAVALAEVLGSRIWSAAIVLAIIAAKPVHDLHGQVLTDSLFLTLINIIATSLLYYGRAPARKWMLLAAAAVGLAISVRPAGWAFVPILPIAVVVFSGWRELARFRTLAVLLLPLLATLAAERAYYAAWYGWERDSQLPLHLFGKGAMLPSTPMPEGLVASYPDAVAESVEALWRAADSGYAPVRRLVAAAKDNGTYCRVLTHYETYAQYSLGRDARAALGVHTDAALRDVGLARITANPGAFLGGAWAYYKCLWRFGLDGGGGAAGSYRDWLETVRPLPFEGELAALLRAVPSRYAGLYLVVGTAAAVLMTGVAVVAGLLSVAAVAFMFTRGAGGPWLRLSGLLALWVNGYFALVALTGVAAARYTLVMLVPLGLMLGLLAHALVTRLRRQ